MTPDPLQIVGKTLAGHFQVESLVGEGRHSVVYRGIHVGPGAPVALKCLKVDLSLTASAAEAFLKNFREENKAAARFARGDSGFVRSIGSGMTTIGSAYVLYLVLEWIDGRPLRDDLVLRRRQGARGRSFEEAARLLLPVAEAVARAHEAGLVHGDVCPGNVVFTSTGETRLLDLAVSLHLEELSKGLRSFSHLYAAPERLKGAPPSPQVDVYSLGAILFELLSDRSPIEAATYEEATKHASDDLLRPNPNRLPEKLTPPARDILVRALSKRPEDRPDTAIAFASMLAALLPKEPGPFANAGQFDLAPTPMTPIVTRAPSSPPQPASAQRPSGAPTSGVMRAALRNLPPEDATPTSEMIMRPPHSQPVAGAADILAPSTAPNLPLPPLGKAAPSGPQVVAHPPLPSSARIKAAPRSSEGGHAISGVTVPKAETQIAAGDLPSVIVASDEHDNERAARNRQTLTMDRSPFYESLDTSPETSPRIKVPRGSGGKVALILFFAAFALGATFFLLHTTGALDGLLYRRR